MLKFLRPHILVEEANAELSAELTPEMRLAAMAAPDSRLARNRLPLLNARIKHRIYAKIEHDFQYEIVQSTTSDNRIYFVHDGWYSTKPIAITQLGVPHSHHVEVDLDIHTLMSWIKSASRARRNKSAQNTGITIKTV